MIEIFQDASKSNLIKKRDILSGPGLVRLFNGTAELLGQTIRVSLSQEVIKYALDSDFHEEQLIAHKTIELFIEFLGLSITNTILSNLVEEIYIFGGLIQGLQEVGLIDQERLRITIEEFSGESMQEFVNESSVHLVKIEYPTFPGLRELVLHDIPDIP